MGLSNKIKKISSRASSNSQISSEFYQDIKSVLGDKRVIEFSVYPALHKDEARLLYIK